MTNLITHQQVEAILGIKKLFGTKAAAIILRGFGVELEEALAILVKG